MHIKAGRGDEIEKTNVAMAITPEMEIKMKKTQASGSFWNAKTVKIPRRPRNSPNCIPPLWYSTLKGYTVVRHIPSIWVAAFRVNHLSYARKRIGGDSSRDGAGFIRNLSCQNGDYLSSNLSGKWVMATSPRKKRKKQMRRYQTQSTDHVFIQVCMAHIPYRYRAHAEGPSDKWGQIFSQLNLHHHIDILRVRKELTKYLEEAARMDVVRGYTTCST